jgi:CheY-like chemotaxis protein
VETADNDDTVNLILCVKDTGQGMTTGQVSRIFDDYARFNLETNRSISGTGLGMSITKRLIDMMNGEIQVESKPGEGSVFTVSLPQRRCCDTVCGGDVAKSLQDFSFSNTSLQINSQIVHEYMPYGKVLIVDDVESNLYVAKGLLMPYGLQIETVNSGFEAIEKIKKDNNYDIVFMDHMMPVMDGIKTTKMLRDMGYKHSIIALTANAVIGQEEMFLQNGFDGFISKPIDSRELNQILIELIRNKKNEKAEGIYPVPVNHQAEETITKETIKNEKLLMAAAFDIKNSISVLEEVLPKINADYESIGAANLELFTTTVHGMKSALANIGENRLAETAQKLEQAGGNSDIILIHQKTPEFILSLGALLEKIKYPNAGDNVTASNDDMAFLQIKMNEIKTACGKFIPGDAKKAIAELKQKTWPSGIDFIINEISVYLLRGEYSKAVSVVDNFYL